jgi:hypothetical protein
MRRSGGRVRHTIIIAVLASLLALAPTGAQDPAGQGKDAPAPEAPQAPAPAATETLTGVSWFPLELDRRWHYKVSFSIRSSAGEEQEPETAPHSLDVYVTEPQEIDGRPVACLEWKLDGQLAQRDFFFTRDKVLYCVKRIQGFGEHMKDFSLVEAQPTAREDLAVGQKWEWQGKAGTTPGRQTFEVVREEEVTTNAGTFRCLVLQMEFVGDDESRGLTTRWLAKGVGIVREVSEVRTASSVFRTEGTLHRHEGGKK